MWTDEELASLFPDERTELMRRLAALDGRSAQPRPPSASRRARRFYLELLVAACLVLIPWIVVLAVTLPHQYDAHNWDVAWVGFDLALLLGLAATAWAVWRRRQVAVPAAIVTGTLLTTDAWFDVMTASTQRDRAWSIAFALLIELPLAAALVLLARRIVVMSVRAARESAGLPGPHPPMWRLPLFLVTDEVVSDD